MSGPLDAEPFDARSPGITRVVRESGIVLLTRIAGLLLSAIAVQPVADSVRGFLAEG